MGSFVGIICKKLQWLEHKRWLYWILTLALVFRLEYVWHQPPTILEYDAAAYRGLGHSLATGKGFTGDGSYGPTHWAPFTPFLLAGIYWLGGTDFAARIVWACLSTGAIIVAFLLARRRHGLLAANLVALGIAIYPYDIVICGSTSTDVPSVLFLLATLFFLNHWLDTARHRDLIAFYVLLGLSTLNRPAVAVLVLAPIVSLWLSRRGQNLRSPRCLRGIGLGICVFLALTLPWSVRTSKIVGRPVFVTSAMPSALWESNNPWVIDRFEGRIDSHEFFNRLQAVTSNAQGITEYDEAYLRATKSFLWLAPIGALRLQLYKARTFWGIPGMRGASATKSLRGIRRVALLVGWLVWMPLVFFFLLAIADYWYHKTSGIGLYLWWIALMVVTTIPFGGVARYRIGGLIDILMIVTVMAFMETQLYRQRKVGDRIATVKEPKL